MDLRYNKRAIPRMTEHTDVQINDDVVDKQTIPTVAYILLYGNHWLGTDYTQIYR